MSAPLEFAIVLPDHEARIGVEAALAQARGGPRVFDRLGPDGASACLDAFDLHLITSPHAVAYLGLRKFAPHAGCFAIAAPPIRDGLAWALVSPGEILLRAMTNEEIETALREIPRRWRRERVVRLRMPAEEESVAQILRFDSEQPTAGYLVGNPGASYMRSVIAVADRRVSRHGPVVDTEDAEILAKDLAANYPITAADIEVFLRRHSRWVSRAVLRRIAIDARRDVAFGMEARGWMH